MKNRTEQPAHRQPQPNELLLETGVDTIDQVKPAIYEAVAMLYLEDPAAGEYFARHLVFDQVNKTIQYTGDSRFDQGFPQLQGLAKVLLSVIVNPEPLRPFFQLANNSSL